MYLQPPQPNSPSTPPLPKTAHQFPTKSPVILNVEVFRSDGRVDGVVQALGRRDLVVGGPGRLRVDDRLVDVTPGMRPVRWAGRRAATTDKGAAVILAVQPKNISSTCQTHREPLYQRRLVR